MKSIFLELTTERDPVRKVWINASQIEKMERQADSTYVSLVDTAVWVHETPEVILKRAAQTVAGEGRVDL